MLRRGFVVAILSAGALGSLAASQTAARQQVSQAEALYQNSPKNGMSCAACALFRPPAACVVVTGAISPHGWCRFFDLPD
jgi:hypothetical protein